MLKTKKELNINWKKVLKILITIILVITMLMMFNNVFADDITAEDLQNSSDPGSVVLSVITVLLNGILGILFYIPALVAGAIVTVFYLVVSLLFFLLGNNTMFVTPADIFYNRIPILSIDFFDFASGDSSVLEIRTEVAKWFVVLSGVAAVFLLGVLIYIAIRAVMANTGKSKAKYQKMFVDWLVSLVMLAGLGIIIVGSIMLNNSFVRIIEKSAIQIMGGKDFSSIITGLLVGMLKPLNFIGQVSSIILLAVLTLQLFQFTFVYMKRMIKIAFLIMIAPLVTITYSVDKIADNKSQALNTWAHVFIFNVFIQTFHALIFSIFFILSYNVAVKPDHSWDLLGTFSSSLPGTILAIVSLRFIGEAEKIIRQIFSITDGERLQDGSKLTSFVIAGKAIDYTQGKLKDAMERQGKSRVFDSTIETSIGDSSADERRALRDESRLDPDFIGPMPLPEMDRTALDGAIPQRVAQATGPNLDLDSDIYGMMNKEDPRSVEGGKLRRAYEKSKGFIRDTAHTASKKKVFTNAGTIAGASLAIASGDLTAAWGIATSSRNIGKLTDQNIKMSKKAREERAGLTKEQLYIKNTKDAAREGIKAYEMSRLIYDEDPQLDTDEGIAKMQEWFRMVKDKTGTGDLLKEYKAGRMDLIKQMQMDQGVNRAEAIAISYQLEKMLLAGKTPEAGTRMAEVYNSNAGRNFAAVAIEKKQSDDMKQYNELESDMRNATYEYDNVRNILTDKAYVDELKDLDQAAQVAGRTVPVAAPLPTMPTTEAEEDSEITRESFESGRPEFVGEVDKDKPLPETDVKTDRKDLDGTEDPMKAMDDKQIKILEGLLDEAIAENISLENENERISRAKVADEKALKEAIREENQLEIDRLRRSIVNMTEQLGEIADAKERKDIQMEELRETIKKGLEGQEIEKAEELASGKEDVKAEKTIAGGTEEKKTSGKSKAKKSGPTREDFEEKKSKTTKTETKTETKTDENKDNK